MLRLHNWPRLLLTLPFTVRLTIVGGTTVLTLAIYFISFPVLHNGNVLVITCGLAAWIFKRRGLSIYLVVAFIIGVIYHAIRFHTLLWPLPFALSFIGGFILLIIIGFIVITLRNLLDAADDARRKAQEAEQQIAAAYEQQRRLNELKNQFILNVNHELRSPLTVVSGYLSLLLDKHERFDRTAQVGFLKNALRSCNELQTLTNDVLDTMELSGQKETLRLENIAVSDVARETVASFGAVWEGQQKTRLDIPDEVVVRGNLQSLRHVLRNLLSNAYKYSPAHSNIVVSATIPTQSASTSSLSSPVSPGSPATPQPEVCISIKDDGPGIPPDQVPLLFGQFVRLPRDLASSVRGSGLGLYICKNLVEAMGGRIWVESSGVAGEGSRFCFTLPCAITTDISA
jgi:signal transduction histidine kinase